MAVEDRSRRLGAKRKGSQRMLTALEVRPEGLPFCDFRKVGVAIPFFEGGDESVTFFEVCFCKLVVKSTAEFISILGLDRDGVGGDADTGVSFADDSVVNQVIVEVRDREDAGFAYVEDFEG